MYDVGSTELCPLEGPGAQAGPSRRTPAWAPSRPRRVESRESLVIRRRPPTKNGSGASAPTFRSGR
eukprot:2897328-Alexandrium_andersonii.AAC.1